MNVSVTISEKIVTIRLSGNGDHNEGILKLLSGFRDQKAEIVADFDYRGGYSTQKVKFVDIRITKPQNETDS